MDTGNGMPTPLLFMKFTTDLQNRVMSHIILLPKEAKKASLSCVMIRIKSNIKPDQKLPNDFTPQ